MPALKVHERAGMTLIAKNHFGSQSRTDAKHLHNGLVNPDGMPVENPKRAGYGLYRVQVDLMGHEKLGNNTMLFVVDGLWGGPGANVPPTKWKMAPFNNDWPSSIFMSQDQVALASVCLDFLKAEFTSDKHNVTYPQMEGVDDYLHQAADQSSWPEGIQYDPEKDGTVLTSLGVHEHWNNATDKMYSRDLGTGEGIELVKLLDVTHVADAFSTNLPTAFQMEENYPNPFNSSTNIRYYLIEAADVEMSLFNVQGRRIQTLVHAYQTAGDYEVEWDGRLADGRPAASGIYLARFFVRGSKSNHTQVQQMFLIR